jgi:hypothetical protein
MNAKTIPPSATRGAYSRQGHSLVRRARPYLLLSILIGTVWPARGTEVIEVRSPDEQELGNFGARVRAISDITGDGSAELAVTAFHNADPRGPRGAVFVLNGRDFSVVSRSDPPYPDTDPFADAGSFGWSLQEIPDSNGDGIHDLIAGAIYADRPDSFALGYGQAYIINPASGAILRMLSAPRDLRGTYFGWDSARLPATVDGQGDRIAISAPRGSGGGRIHLLGATDGELLVSFRAPAPASDDFFGASLAAIDDVDGDGRADLAVGSGSLNNENDSSIGAAWIVSGESGHGLHQLIPPDVPANTRFRWAVAAVPDMNGDGKTDVLVGIPFATPPGALLYSGRACLFSGADGKWLRTLASPEPRVRGFFGWSVAGLPDITGDGTPELLVGAGAFFRFGYGERRVYLLDGATGVPIRVFSSPNGGEGFGLSVTGMLNGNGKLKSVVSGAPQETPLPAPLRPGRVYAFPLSLPGPPEVCALGFTANGLRLQVTGRSGSTVEIHGSSDIVTWELIAAPAMADIPVEIEDTAAASLPRRFYRAVEKE